MRRSVHLLLFITGRSPRYSLTGPRPRSSSCRANSNIVRGESIIRTHSVPIPSAKGSFPNGENHGSAYRSVGSPTRRRARHSAAPSSARSMPSTSVATPASSISPRARRAPRSSTPLATFSAVRRDASTSGSGSPGRGSSRVGSHGWVAGWRSTCWTARLRSATSRRSRWTSGRRQFDALSAAIAARAPRGRGSAGVRSVVGTAGANAFGVQPGLMPQRCPMDSCPTPGIHLGYPPNSAAGSSITGTRSSSTSSRSSCGSSRAERYAHAPRG